MHLGINGRKAIVCASSRGLGLGTAKALAEAGCDLVINGRDETRLNQIARELSTAHNVTVIPVAADISTPEGQQAVLAACPNPDILINNNGGPPRKDFKELDREASLAGIVQNMITPIELTKAVIEGMAERRFGRIVNITSMSVKMPIEGLDLSSGARAGLTAFLAGVCRQYAQYNVTINNVCPASLIRIASKGDLSVRHSKPAFLWKKLKECPPRKYRQNALVILMNSAMPVHSCVLRTLGI